MARNDIEQTLELPYEASPVFLFNFIEEDLRASIK